MKTTKHFEKNYLHGVAGVLVLTAIAKLFSLSSSEGVWSVNEPIFGLAYRPLFAILAGLELVLAVCVLCRLPLQLKHSLIGLFAACGICYHAARAFAQIPEPCPCLGKLFEWSPWLERHGGMIALGILVFFAVMSLYFALLATRSIPTNADSSYVDAINPRPQ